MQRMTLLLTIFLVTLAARAQPGSDALEALLEQMDSPTLVDRETAEREMSALPGITLGQVERLARADGLSPEQVFRLRQVGRRLFDLRPLAGMGVQFQGFSDEGVIIADTIKGFPARDVLEPLDTIQVLNGRKMRTQDDLRWAILSRDPGDVLSLVVKRADKTLEVEVRLGRFDDLPNAQKPSAVDLAYAFGKRWSRVVGEPLVEMDSIGRAITVEQWARVEAGQLGDNLDPMWPLTRDSASRILAFGGLPRSALSIRQALADFSGPMMAGDPARERVSTIAQLVDQMRSLSRQRIVVDQRAQTLARHADMVTDEARREQLKGMRNAALQELLSIDAQLAALREGLRQIREDGRE